MTRLLWIGLAGAAGSFHCLGMCSVFAWSLAPSPTARWRTVGRQLLYNSGRAVSYCFLGVMAGSLGHWIEWIGGAGGPLSVMQRVLALVSGVLMVVMGLQLFGVRRATGIGSGAGSGAGLASLLRGVRGLLRAPGAAAPLAFGVFNGFLPCPLVYAFVAQAVATGTLGGGVSTMAAFALGTFPAMLLVGLAGVTLGPKWRTRGVRVAGAVILLFAVVTLGRGLFPMAPMPSMLPDPPMAGSPAARP